MVPVFIHLCAQAHTQTFWTLFTGYICFFGSPKHVDKASFSLAGAQCICTKRLVSQFGPE